MDLNILSFDQFKSFAKRHYDRATQEHKVDTAAFMSRGIFAHLPMVLTESKLGWSGADQKMYLPYHTNVMTLIHEAFHYFLCPKERLKYNDFGLGVGSESYNLGECPVIARSERDQEEECVCYLTVSMAKRLRVPTGGIMEEMHYADLSDFFLDDKIGARDEFSACVSFIKKRNIERFGLKVEYPLF